MDAIFNNAVQHTLIDEGVLSDNPNDAGGLTKYGITQETWTGYRAKHPELKLPQSVAKITKDQAITVYYEEYWLAEHLDKLPSELSPVVFDFRINSGDIAIKRLQRMIGVPEDGDLGPVSLAKFANLNTTQLRRMRNDYVTVRGIFLMDLAQHHSNDVVFIEGWFKRIVGQYDFAY